MIELILDCYDAKVHGREMRLQVHARRIKGDVESGVRFEIWDLDCKELVAVFKVNDFDFKEFLRLAKAWILEKEAEEE